jgi:hypothetical protein
MARAGDSPPGGAGTSPFFCGSLLHGADADATVTGVLAFLSLQPGDTDSEYFEGYTPEQPALARAEGANRSLYVEGLEQR